MLLFRIGFKCTMNGVVDFRMLRFSSLVNHFVELQSKQWLALNSNFFHYFCKFVSKIFIFHFPNDFMNFISEVSSEIYFRQNLNLLSQLGENQISGNKGEKTIVKDRLPQSFGIVQRWILIRIIGLVLSWSGQKIISKLIIRIAVENRSNHLTKGNLHQTFNIYWLMNISVFGRQNVTTLYKSANWNAINFSRKNRKDRNQKLEETNSLNWAQNLKVTRIVSFKWSKAAKRTSTEEEDLRIYGFNLESWTWFSFKFNCKYNERKIFKIFVENENIKLHHLNEPRN